MIASALLPYCLIQWKNEPEMRIEDSYKWIYHATHGGDHAVGDSEEGPRRWMEREWSTLGRPQSGEPEVVKLDPEGRLLRINLRPYKARGGDKEMLLALFVASAKRFRPDPATFRREWTSLGERLRERPRGHLSYTEWKRLDGATRRFGYPAIHHSAEFERVARPAYRVILGELWVSPGTTRARAGS
jgi:hypothetical protein